MPMRPPTNSLAEPAVWFHEPAVRFGSSLVMALLEMVAPGTLAALWDASYSACAFCCLARPSA